MKSNVGEIETADVLLETDNSSREESGEDRSCRSQAEPKDKGQAVDRKRPIRSLGSDAKAPDIAPEISIKMVLKQDEKRIKELLKWLLEQIRSRRQEAA